MTLVEHDFVVTIEAAAVLQRSAVLLSRLEFEIDARDATTLTANRSMRGLLPPGMLQRTRANVRVEFDRGRVTIAALIPQHRRLGRRHEELLLALATSIENDDTAPWDRAAGVLRDEMKRKFRNRRFAVAVVFAVLAAAILLIVYAANRGR